MIPKRSFFFFNLWHSSACQAFSLSCCLHQFSEARSQLPAIFRGVHLWRPCFLLCILLALCSSYWVVSYCVKGRGGYFLASLQQPLEERIEIKITGRKASGSMKGCGPEEALASKFMAFWRTQELDGDEEGKKQARQGAQGPSGVGVFGGLLASRSPFGGSWRSPTGVQRALPTLRSQNLLPPKLDPLQFCWAWLDQARPFLNYCLFLFAKIPLLGSGVISKAQLLQGINVWHSCLGHFFHHLN